MWIFCLNLFQKNKKIEWKIIDIFIIFFWPRDCYVGQVYDKLLNPDDAPDFRMKSRVRCSRENHDSVESWEIHTNRSKTSKKIKILKFVDCVGELERDRYIL